MKTITTIETTIRISRRIEEHECTLGFKERDS